ncbi:MAG: class I SAM-dependent methyltransferase [Desulfocapsa sp.]|nr:class I SAM-dependent methyltransferase [Desulfocapsa sp.]
MKKTDIPEINIDEIMERIRVEVEKRKSLPGDTLEESGGAVQKNNASSQSQVSAVVNDSLPEGSMDYGVNKLCQYHDIDFIRNAYRVILQREPGLDELNVWLPRFRAGELTKKEILAQLRFGTEGRQKKVAIRGLLLPFLLYRSYKIPVLGKLLRIMGCIIHLPLLFRNIQGLEYAVNSRYDQLTNHIAELKKQIQAVESALPQKVGWPHVSSLYKTMQVTDGRLKATDGRLKATDDRLKVTGDRLKETDDRLKVTDGRLSYVIHESLGKINQELTNIDRQARDYKLNILAQQRRLDDLLAQGRSSIPLPTEGLAGVQATEADHILDAMYVSFEDRFRGTREDIKGRQRVYLPYVEKVQEKTGTGIILDVGCGRGEWLELLGEYGYKAKGVDLNAMMVAQSQELGLDVEVGDVFDYFTDMGPESLAVVTGFHIVEHLPLKTMLALFDQAYRVLKPGGMVIFETPNPENILVGSCNFYYDPTHRNPIPPEVLRFLLEARGYEGLEIVRLHENREYLELKESNISEKITSRFYGPQDYSVIGYKA